MTDQHREVERAGKQKTALASLRDGLLFCAVALDPKQPEAVLRRWVYHYYT
jgi:hypothetical protein